MKTLYKVINTQNVYDLGVRLGDVVDAVKSDDGLFRGTCKGGYLRWDIPVMTFQKYQLEKIDSVSEGSAEAVFKAIASSALQVPPTTEKTVLTKHGVLLPVYNNEGTAYSVDHPMCPCTAPTSPETDIPLPEVPPEAKEASTVLPVPSTSTSHDAHYASMAVEPVTISEMMMENEAIPPKARYHAAKAVEYFTRAGLKEGQDWKKEFEKALNHGYRAIHGKWPWEVRDH